MTLLDLRWLLPWAPSEARTQPKPRGRHRLQRTERPLPVNIEYWHPRVRPPAKHPKRYRWET